MDAAGDHGPILVVDDDAALAEMLQLVLIKEGFSTAWVGHGSDVMDVFRAVSYTPLTLPTQA